MNHTYKKMLKLKKIFNPLNLTGKVFVYAYALILIVPLAFAIITSFKSGADLSANPIGLPKEWLFENFKTAWVDGNLLMAAKNSILITGISLLIQTFGIIFATFHLDCIRETKIGVFMYMLLISSLFVPSVCSVTSLALRRELGLYDNLIGEIICGSTLNAFGVFIVSGAVRSLPKEMREAAWMDGAGDFYYMMKIMTPLVKPSITTVTLLNFTSKWNDSLGAILTLRREELWTIPMALLLNFKEQYSVKHEIMFAGLLLTSIPLIVAYCTCQKHFVEALAGSVKG